MLLLLALRCVFSPILPPSLRAVKTVDSAAVLKRSVGYEMSRLGHYLTQASLAVPSNHWEVPAIAPAVL